jgi:hypothetical protein
VFLRNVLDLVESIDECRRDMYELAENRAFSDPEVVNISQQLDGKITMLQKIIHELRSLPTGTAVFRAYK